MVSSIKWAFLVSALSLVSALTLGLAPGAFAQAPAVSQPQMLPAVPLPMSHPQARYFATHPAEWQAWQKLMARPRVQVPPAKTPPLPNPWHGLNNLYPGSNASAPNLLTDGSVMVHDMCGANWYRLTPDNTGSYVNGTWSAAIPLPSGYGPLFFGSEVLPDGRFIINGGEYNNTGSGCSQAFTTLGAIYDPVANSWTNVPPPPGGIIGDAESVVLPNGTYMLADCCASSPMAALLTNPTSFIWTPTGTGKSDSYDEEGWSLLPTGNVLTVDAYVSDFPNKCVAPNNKNTELYTPSSGSWASAGNTPSQLADCSATDENGGPSYEMGPVVQRTDGLVLAFGATVDIPATTAFYNPSTGVWTAGPSLTFNGMNYNLADAPAAVEPSGNILYAANVGLFGTPAQFFEVSYPGNTIGTVPNTPMATSDTAFLINLLVLPTGQILQTDESNDIEIYTPSGTYLPSWQPVITSVATTLVPGTTYPIAGTQLNGLSQGAYYGDDVQANTNFDLVRITNTGTGHVFYAKTSGFSSQTIKSGAATTANFNVPAGIELGPSTLVAVANGIPSAAVAVTVSTGVTGVCSSGDAVLVNEVFHAPGTLTFDVSSPTRVLSSITLVTSTNIGSFTAPTIQPGEHSATGGSLVKTDNTKKATFTLQMTFVNPAFACTIDPVIKKVHKKHKEDEEHEERFVNGER